MFNIVPAYRLSPKQVGEYFSTLLEDDLLKYRLGDISNPQLVNAYEMVKQNLRYTFFVQNEYYDVVGEFMLVNIYGDSAQIHFSLHPDNSYKENKTIGLLGNTAPFRDVTLTDESGVPYLKSIYGITPLRNRPACQFALRCGMKKQFILPGGAMHLGEPCDGMVTMKSRVLTTGG